MQYLDIVHFCCILLISRAVVHGMGELFLLHLTHKSSGCSWNGRTVFVASHKSSVRGEGVRGEGGGVVHGMGELFFHSFFYKWTNIKTLDL